MQWHCLADLSRTPGNNHGLSRTGLTNVRPGLSFAERKRGMSVLVRGSADNAVPRLQIIPQ